MIRRVIRRLSRRWSRGPVILLYHRIAGDTVDPFGLCVSPQHFREQLDVLRARGPCLPLSEMVRLGLERNVPRKAVAVTFDDGYADNLHVAVPLLERAGIPATIFITTGVCAAGREFWWDELERLLLRVKDVPAEIELDLGGRSSRFSTGSLADRPVASPPWRAFHDPLPDQRHALYLDLWRRLQAYSDAVRQQMLHDLAEALGTSPAGRPRHPVLDQEEIFRLAGSELIELGAHTVTHPVLPAHPARVQREEIQRSKADLESICGRAVTSFSYPYGEYDEVSRDLVAKAGFARACTTKAAAISRSPDPYALPRLAVPDHDGERFVRWINAFSG